MLKILYFASLRERLGQGSETLALPAEVHTVADLLAHLAARGGVWAGLPDLPNLRCALNQEMTSRSAAVSAGDEVAFFPPVTGG